MNPAREIPENTNPNSDPGGGAITRRSCAEEVNATVTINVAKRRKRGPCESSLTRTVRDEELGAAFVPVINQNLLPGAKRPLAAQLEPLPVVADAPGGAACCCYGGCVGGGGGGEGGGGRGGGGELRRGERGVVYEVAQRRQGAVAALACDARKHQGMGIKRGEKRRPLEAVSNIVVSARYGDSGYPEISADIRTWDVHSERPGVDHGQGPENLCVARKRGKERGCETERHTAAEQQAGGVRVCS